MKEIEILVKVNCPIDEALSVLNKFEFEETTSLLDIYYHDPSTKKFSPNNSSCPTEWVRVRKKGDKSFITYKNDIFKEGTWQYSEEEEVLIEDFEKMNLIITKLGFVELIRINNNRHIFKTDLYEIVLEEVEELGLFMEVERLDVADTDSVDQIRIEIQAFIDALDLHVSPESDEGKPGLILKKLNLI